MTDKRDGQMRRICDGISFIIVHTTAQTHLLIHGNEVLVGLDVRVKPNHDKNKRK